MKKIIMISMLMLTVLFTGCEKSKAEKEIEKQDTQELKEAEALMTLWGLEEDEIEKELELIKEEQEKTKEERIKGEQEDDMKLIEEEIEKAQEQAEAERKAEEARLEAERLEYERIEKEKREAEERAWKEREDFMYGLTAQQTGGLPCKIEWWDSYIIVHITDNEQNLVNSVANDAEDVRYTQIKQNIALWSGEMKEKYTKQFNIHFENFTVKYNYYAGENWFGTAEDGFGVSDYLMY
jgi:HD superfamily phosphohydrolase